MVLFLRGAGGAMTDTARPVYRLDQTKAHTRYRLASGEIVPGVTTVLGLLDKPALLKWAWNCGRDGIDIEKARDSAASVGTICHARIEAWLRGMDFDAANVSHEFIERSTIGFTRFVDWWRSQELTVEACELKLISERLRVGGTADILAKRPNGRRLLIDVKTANGIYREQRIQVATYAAMWEEVTMTPLDVFSGAPMIDEVWIVRVGKDEADDIEPVEVRNREACLAAFAALAQTYHLLKAVK